jgi:hypothetical protein
VQVVGGVETCRQCPRQGHRQDLGYCLYSMSTSGCRYAAMGRVSRGERFAPAFSPRRAALRLGQKLLHSGPSMSMERNHGECDGQPPPRRPAFDCLSPPPSDGGMLQCKRPAPGRRSASRWKAAGHSSMAVDEPASTHARTDERSAATAFVHRPTGQAGEGEGSSVEGGYDMSGVHVRRNHGIMEACWKGRDDERLDWIPAMGP